MRDNYIVNFYNSERQTIQPAFHALKFDKSVYLSMCLHVSLLLQSVYLAMCLHVSLLLHTVMLIPIDCAHHVV